MANSTCKIKDRQVFGEHVDSTLLLVEIHRCKICNFYSAHSGAMSDHIWASHAETLGGDVTRVPGYKEALQEQDPDIPLKRVLNEIQNLPSLKSLPPKDQVDLKFLSNLRKDCGAGGFQLQQSAMLNDSELNLSRLFEFLISESYSFESESLPEQDPGRYFREDTDMKESESREIFTAVMDPGFKVKNIAENPIVHRTKRISRSQDYRAKLAKINSPKAASISASSVKLDFNRAYENMLEAAKATNSKERKNVSVVDVRVSSEKPKQPFVDLSQSSEEPIQSQAPGSALEPVQVPGTTSEPDQEFLPQLSLLDPDDTSKVESAAMSGQEKNPENDLQLQSSLSGDGESNVDTVAGPSTGEDTLKNAASPVNRGPAPDGDQPTPEVPPIIKGSKTYAHNVDFQAIAQQASHSNPEATTITVVQHTSGDRPPLTINFKKSHKSEAIIPTGESLGIRSPFRKMEYSGSKVFACKECHSRYKTANELERHVLKKHQKKKSYLCEICGDALATRSGMKVHIQRKHAVSDVLTCDVCDYMTRSTTRFAVHLKKHNKSTSSFYCEPCKKSFVTESKLEQHKKSPMHKNAVDPIICEHCGYVTKKRDNFLVHIRKHTGEKPYRCKHCDYGAADGSTLKRHVMARHSSIRPFRCTDCQFSCVDKKGLTVHMRKHTGERPYRCDLCPYAAKRSGALTVHRRTHFVDKPSELSPKEDTDTSTEVASYVDISEIPIAHMPLGNALLQSTSQPRIHVPTQNQGSSSIAASQQGITPNQSSNSTVQEQDHTVQALWQSMS